MNRPVIDDRRTFWPRVGPVGFVPDLGDDRPCANCGYNLRGLAYDSACPECGALFGINPACEQMPWDDEERRGVFGFIAAVFVVLLRPRDLGGQVWGGEPIDGKAAIRFRRICIVIGTIFLSIVVFALTAEALGLVPALCCLVLDVMAITLWLNLFTHGAIHFFEDKGAGSARRRAMALARYAAAPFALMPLHLLLAPMHWRVLAEVGLRSSAAVDGWVMLLVGHGAILVVQLLACASAEAALLWQVVSVSRMGASALAAADVLVRTLIGSIYFLWLPVLIALVAISLGH
jgi:hypothetical protein